MDNTGDMTSHPADNGPCYHGTRARLQPGDHLTAGCASNYRPEVIMNHVYFSATRDVAGLAAEIAALLGPEHAKGYVYVVHPTGPFENDPNVTDKKFPGNPTRSYRTATPLAVVEEVTDWTRLTPEALETWRERVETMRITNAEIIN